MASSVLLPMQHSRSMPLTAAVSRLGDAIVIAAVAPFAALSLFNLKRLLLGVMLLEIPLQLDTWLAYREEIAALSGLGGFNMGVMTGCLFALGLIWIFELGLGIERAPSGLLRPCWPAMLYTLVVGRIFPPPASRVSPPTS